MTVIHSSSHCCIFIFIFTGIWYNILSGISKFAVITNVSVKTEIVAYDEKYIYLVAGGCMIYLIACRYLTVFFLFLSLFPQGICDLLYIGVHSSDGVSVFVQ